MYLENCEMKKLPDSITLSVCLGHTDVASLECQLNFVQVANYATFLVWPPLTSHSLATHS